MTDQKSGFTFDDMKKIVRNHLPKTVPLELFRTIRLIGMYQGLPLNGKGTTTVVGKTIGESLPVSSVEDILNIFQELNVGIPSIINQDEQKMRIAIDDCFCDGLPVQEGKFVCDLEGAILEGALAKVLDKKVKVKEVKCNINGDDRCEYDVTIR